MNRKTVEGIAWEAFDTQKIQNYSKDSIVFVDFTADWCITCKANERITFNNETIIQFVKEQNIRMIKADWTRQNPEITTILQKYGSAGVPFYLLYKPGLTTPQVLPTLLTPSIFMDAITLGDKK
jgi:thiol:disulfide interchange protein DsbD